MKKTINNRILSLALAGAMTLAAGFSLPSVSYAAPPGVSVDESVYVNLDHYGGISDVSIVKGCDLNGNTGFTDYGTYEAVTNMSGYEKPVLTPGGVQWNLSGGKEHPRFYFDGTLNKEAIELPWTFDVSYQLNGVPVKADSLAGASGLIEIDIKATPNEKAREYYKNNMLLQVAAYVDMEDTYSLDAPGSQLQSVGSKKIVMFSALPGEAETFTIRIGTNSFETKGITMMMVPGTLDQFKSIKDLKEAKDTLEDSSDAIYASMNEILLTMESMNSGLAMMKDGTAGLENARSTFSSGSDELYDDFDKAMGDLDTVNDQLANMIPYFQTGQRMIRSVSNDIDDLSDALSDYEAPLNDADDSITVVQSDLAELGVLLATLNAQTETMLNELGDAANAGYATTYEAIGLENQAEMASTLQNHMGAVSSLLTETVKMGDTAKEIIQVTNDVTEAMVDAGDTFNRYEDDLLSLLDDAEQLTVLINSSLSSTITCLTYSKSLLQKTSDILDPAMEKTLLGMEDLLVKSLQNVDDITALRKAGTTVKQTVDEQFDKFDNENRFLNLDSEAELQSFTSDKNPPPESIQVILRTQEISLDSIDDNSDLETQKESKGILARIVDIFKEIGNKIASLFN